VVDQQPTFFYTRPSQNLSFGETSPACPATLDLEHLPTNRALRDTHFNTYTKTDHFQPHNQGIGIYF
jgi:hypothetical protein